MNYLIHIKNITYIYLGYLLFYPRIYKQVNFHLLLLLLWSMGQPTKQTAPTVELKETQKKRNIFFVYFSPAVHIRTYTNKHESD